MIVAIFIGIFTGLLFSIPPGPVNATIISRTMHHGSRFGFAVGLGAAIMDFIYCGGAAQIHEFLARSPIINLSFQAIGFFVLLWLGIKFFRTSPTTAHKPTGKTVHQKEMVAEHQVEKLHVKQSSIVGSVLIGIVLYVSNVAGIPEWIIVSAFWRNSGLLKEGVDINAAYALGATLGAGFWFFLVVRFLGKRIRSMKAHTIFLINRFSAIGMLVFGVYFGYQIAFKTDWGRVNERWKEGIHKKVDSTATNSK
ncbi:MAG TPA: LysE family transporter [Candidatus Kapabacteria bacterium]|nr:LysE family transporter [Candidatus Kapabacteria bacterium]